MTEKYKQLRHENYNYYNNVHFDGNVERETDKLDQCINKYFEAFATPLKLL